MQEFCSERAIRLSVAHRPVAITRGPRCTTAKPARHRKPRQTEPYRAKGYATRANLQASSGRSMALANRRIATADLPFADATHALSSAGVASQRNSD